MKKNKKAKQNELELYFLIPLAFILAVVPLIVFLKVVPVDGIVKYNWIQDVNYDFFSYYKAQALKLSTVAAIIMFVICRQTNRLEIKKTKLYIPMGIYSLMVVLSTVFSKYKGVALNGFPDRYEGMWVLLCYMAILFITINMVQTEKHIKFLIGSLFVSAFVVGLIGTFQFFGYDVFNTDFGKKLILPSQYEHLAALLKFEFEHSNAIYATLFNINYVGSYVSLILPLSVTCLLISNNKILKVSLAILTIAMFFILVGSRSRGGLIGITATLLLMIVMLRKQIIENLKITSLAVVSLICIFLFVNTISSGVVIKRLSMILSQEQTNFYYAIDDITINGNRLEFKFKDAEVNVIYNGNQFYFVGKNGEDIPLTYDKGRIVFDDPVLKKYYFEIRNWDEKYYLDYKNLSLNFLVHEDEFKLINGMNVPVPLQDIDKLGFAGYERLGSNRGYIWSRTLPLFRKTSILGLGPDSFAIGFPQHDYIGKLKTFQTINIIVDKPHNLFLQIGINTGLISLLALLILFGKYILSSGALYIKSTYVDLEEYTGVGILLSILAYLVTGLFNDSIVSVAPIFWVLLGIGINTNFRLTSNYSK